ncbi:MAG: hypothetical protein V2J11_02825 [Desulfofustis sp.]|jgi:hypothetical protein|nr:hypothetical protein [Desulfofustis sp.]
MKVQTLFLLSLLAGAVTAHAAEPIVYPANNQTPEMQAKDQQECRQWAIGQAGYDPVLGATGSAVQPGPSAAGQKKDRTVLRSAARGAAVGGLGGSMGGEFGKGAGAGAIAGGVGGLVKKSKQDQAKQQTAPMTAESTELEDKYYRAYGVCLEARGYSVK